MQVVEAGLGYLPFTERVVVTPTGHQYVGVDFAKKLCGVSIIRSGESMENALRACCKGIKIGKILVHRWGAPASPTPLWLAGRPWLSQHQGAGHRPCRGCAPQAACTLGCLRAAPRMLDRPQLLYLQGDPCGGDHAVRCLSALRSGQSPLCTALALPRRPACAHAPPRLWCPSLMPQDGGSGDGPGDCV